MSEKNIVFISHANPQDNDAALWLASKLSLAGYEVWSDSTKLFGGEIFWDDIEEVIRNHASKFVILVSRNSQYSSGVLDELNLALIVERKNKIPRFVIPIRLDNTPFDEFRVNIGRKKAVDFSRSWAIGLESLIHRLKEDSTPQNSKTVPDDISSWINTNLDPPANFTEYPVTFCSNWVRIRSMPRNLYFSRMPLPEKNSRELIKQFNTPAFMYQNHAGSFAEQSELQSNMPKYAILTQAFAVDVNDFVNGTAHHFPTLKWQDGQNILTNLIKKSWSLYMKQLGMVPYELSNFTTAWYAPKGLITKDSVKYIDSDGKQRTKKLIGRSERLGANWHFAVSVQPSFSRFRHLILKAHVIFTMDGVTPIFDKERMHRMRRSFCRSWWNERWRGLLLAYLTYISSSSKEIHLPVSSSENIVLNSQPVLFSSPFFVEESNIPYAETSDEEFDDYDLYDSDGDAEEDDLVLETDDGND